MPAPDLLLGHRLRPDRALRRPRRLRPDGAGHGRDHGPDRRRRTASRSARACRSPTSSPASIRRSASSPRSPSASAPAAAAWSTPPCVDSQVGVLANQALNYLVSGEVPKRIGNAHPNIVPYQVFPVADGHIIIATGNDNQFAKLCAVLGEPEIAAAAELPRQFRSARAPRRADRAALRADPTLVARRPLGEARSGAGSGRTDQPARPGFCRPAGACIAECGSTGRAPKPRPAPSRRAHADHHRRPADGGGAPRPAARRAHGGSPAEIGEA